MTNKNQMDFINHFDNIRCEVLSQGLNETIDNNVVQLQSHKELGESRNLYCTLFKRICDIICSLIAIAILSPILLVISILIKMTSKGPVVYKQNRVGKQGQIFSIYKFRSMVNDAYNFRKYLSEEQINYYRINRKLNNDPRVTKVGRIIRRTSLDELPQLVNILKGDMSIVGPRPMMPEEIKMYGKNYKLYITTKPGLTGLWQIHGRFRTSMKQRMRLDVIYIKNQGILTDIKIIFRTFVVVILQKGAF